MEITGGQAIYEALVKLGVTKVFGIPSVHNIPIFDAILQGGKITPVITRHEQAAVHSADGYSRASGELGVVIASTGPGTTNTVTGIYEAAFASSRVMLLTGQTESRDYGKGRAAGHEAENQLPMLRTVARWVESPRYTQDLAPAVFRCAANICTGRPQPGALEIPIDLQYGMTAEPVGEPIAVPPVPPRMDRIDKAADLIGSTSKRVIVAGGGVTNSDASDAVQKMAEALNAPVFVSINGRGAIPDEHELAMGPFINRPQMREALQDAELVIAVGTRLRGPMRAWGHIPKLIHIDVDPAVHGLVSDPAVSIIADAKTSVDTLMDATNAQPGDGEFLERVQLARRQVHSATREVIGPDMEAIMDHMRKTMSADTPFVRDMTTPAYAWGNELFPILEPRTTMNPNSGAIGPGLPMAIGAALAANKKTVAIHGDGGVMLHIGELATAAQYQAPVVLCIFTDGGYGVLRGIQDRTFEGRTIGVDLATPNFAMIAKGMGVEGETVKGVDEFRAAFGRAMEAEGPYVLDIDLNSLVPMKGFGKRIEFEQPSEAS
ncbi:MAG: thiamine pyrophosphate-binding protein [Pseudomonadota bacterium]